MRQPFRETLKTYGEIAKSESEKEKSPEEEERLEHVLDWNLERVAEKRKSSEEAQKVIYEAQQKKQEIMRNLKKDIAELDEPQKEVGESEKRKVRFIQQKGDDFFWQKEDGIEKRVTLGELLTDGDWGIKYHLNYETVSRNVRKKYLIEEARRKLGRFLDFQILTDEIESEYTGEYKKEAYKRILKERKEGKVPTGLIAEKMVKNYLKKLSYDYDVPIEILEADVYQDVTQKIDFVLHRRSYYRGVGIEERKKGEKTIGIQFSTNPSPFALRDKRRQIRRAKKKLKDDYVEDIMLVTIPMEHTRDVYSEWNEDKSPGGPDRLWDNELKKEIFEKVTDSILSPEEIKKEWEKIKK